MIGGVLTIMPRSSTVTVTVIRSLDSQCSVIRDPHIGEHGDDSLRSLNVRQTLILHDIQDGLNLLLTPLQATRKVVAQMLGTSVEYLCVTAHTLALRIRLVKQPPQPPRR